MSLHTFYRSLAIALTCYLTVYFDASLQAAEVNKEVEAAMATLRDECLRCHKPEKKKGGLLLNSREALLKGGDTGPAIVSGDGAKSLLIEGLAKDGDPHMPPKKQLTDKEIKLLTQWINNGAAWDAKTLAKIKAPPAPTASELAGLPVSYRPVLAMAISPDTKTLATGQGGDIVLFDFIQADPKAKTPISLKAKSTLHAHKDAVQSLTWSPDGKRFVSGGHREIQIWQAGQAKPLHTITDKLKGRITDLTITPDNKTLLVADSIPAMNSQVHAIDLATGKILRSIENAHSDSIFDLCLSPDKKHFASVSADKMVKIWDLNTWKPVATLEGHTGYVLATAYSPEGDRLASAGDNGIIKVWNTKNNKQLISIIAKRSGPITGLRWTTDPEKAKKKAAEKDKKKAEAINTDKIFSISEDGQPRSFGDLVQHDGAQRSTGAREKAFNAQEESLASISLAESKDGKAPFPFLFAGSDTGSLFIWDAAGKLVFQQHPDTKIAESTTAKK